MDKNKEEELAVVKTAMTILGYFISILILVLGVPLILEIVEPNTLYGVRTDQTLSDENSWYHLNSLAGWGMLASGILSCLALRFFKNRDDVDMTKAIISISFIPVIFPVFILGALYVAMF